MHTISLTISSVTWHVTMLGEIGANSEGRKFCCCCCRRRVHIMCSILNGFEHITCSFFSHCHNLSLFICIITALPWIERDYTPISSALEWERGRCAILIKMYNDGLLTNWLNEHQKANGTHVWLSKPVRTLSVPSLIADDDDGFRPKSVLLLLAGTGIVALPQVMAHREPIRLLGISLPKYKQMACHVDLIQSCREDDILLLPEIKQYCIEGMRPHPRYSGLRNCTRLLTKEKKTDQEESLPPFNGIFKDSIDYNTILKDAPSNIKTVCSRLDKSIVEDAIGRLDYPYRIIVSGPDGYNNVARELLEECDVESKHVTILSA